MAAFISFQPSDFFSTKLYTGNGTAIGSGGLAVTGVGFQPDFTWIKNREQTDNHILTNSPVGATKYVNSDRDNAQATNAESLTTWGADGFTLGDHAAVNTNAEDFVSWNWKGGTTSGITTDGSTTITPSAYSFSATAGISIVTYTGNSTSGAKMAHGLGVAPEMIITKNLDLAENWFVYHTGIGNTKYLKLDATSGTVTSATAWNNTNPDSVNVTLGNSAQTNGSNSMIAYCFASKKGFSKVKSYIGNGNADGPFLYTGFRPSYVLIKNSGGVEAWNVWNDKTPGFNVSNENLQPDNTSAEQTSVAGVKEIDIVSNGFKVRGSNTELNQDGYVFTYAAFAEFPFVSSNSKAGVAR